MSTGSAFGMVGVLLWARAEDLPTLYGAFLLIGLALAMSTHEAAFAVLVVATDASRRDRAFVVIHADRSRHQPLLPTHRLS
jgi:hypothetical protein